MGFRALCLNAIRTLRVLRGSRPVKAATEYVGRRDFSAALRSPQAKARIEAGPFRWCGRGRDPAAGSRRCPHRSASSARRSQVHSCRRRCRPATGPSPVKPPWRWISGTNVRPVASRRSDAATSSPSKYMASPSCSQAGTLRERDAVQHRVRELVGQDAVERGEVLRRAGHGHPDLAVEAATGPLRAHR